MKGSTKHFLCHLKSRINVSGFKSGLLRNTLQAKLLTHPDPPMQHWRVSKTQNTEGVQKFTNLNPWFQQIGTLEIGITFAISSEFPKPSWLRKASQSSFVTFPGGATLEIARTNMKITSKSHAFEILVAKAGKQLKLVYIFVSTAISFKLQHDLIFVQFSTN